MNPFAQPSNFRRILASLLMALMTLGPAATPAYAALTLLADEPLNVRNAAKPNIVMSIDDSTSMLFDYLPDYVVNVWCRDNVGAMSSECGNGGGSTDLTALARGKYQSPGYIYSQYAIPYPTLRPSASYDTSGPGAGCDLSNFLTAKCFGGTDPGASPGLDTYPRTATLPPPSSKRSGYPYEYNLFWPAPVHNAAMNKLYYDPRLTYDPPSQSTSVSFPTMNAATTTNWTLVPADPWAATQIYVNLTLPVSVGQWCNSDWTQGNDPLTSQPFANDLSHCRTNGVIAAAVNAAPAGNGDYVYPWAPVGMSVADMININKSSPSIDPSLALSIANWKSTIATRTVTANWTNNAQDAKYFYENDNVLWCDPTSPQWPRSAQFIAQTCNGAVSANQTCNGIQNQTCGGGTAQTCNGLLPADCVGELTQTCQNLTAQTCNGAQSQVCNLGPQTCNGVRTQSCSLGAQTCNNVRTQTCQGAGAQTCNGYRTQSCTNIQQVCTPPPPSSCTTAWSPLGCNLLPPSPENICNLVTTCPPPTCVNQGNCSVQTSTVCTSNAQCPAINGSCSRTAGACTQASDCPTSGNCSVNTATSCNVNADCATLPGSCSINAASCFNNAQCVQAGNCTVQTNTVCTSNANCPSPLPGTCSITNTSCTSNAGCANAGFCSVQNTTVCTSNANCPVTNGTCSRTATACTTNAQCPSAGTCSRTAAACVNNAGCPTIAGACAFPANRACTQNSQCSPTPGACSITGLSCSANTATACPNQNKICNIDLRSCTSNANCPTIAGRCSVSNAVCTNTTYPNAGSCPPITTSGTCSITGNTCTSSPTDLVNCPSQALPAASAVCSDLITSGSMSLLADANGSGVVCRHNNKTYGATAAGRFNYPTAQFNTPVSYGTGVNACTVTPRFKAVPRHYWKTSVEWCDRAIATAGDKWLGYGTSAGGTCQAFKDSTHIYPRFYQFGSLPTENYNTAAFQRVDLIAANAPFIHTWLDDQNVVQTVTRTYAEEMTNYANWYAYYRTRIQAVKTVTSLTFKELDNNYRVGFHTLSNVPTSSFLNIADYDAAQKATWFTNLFAIDIALNVETPNLNAMMRIGEYFKNGASASLAGATDPIILSCQKNWHMLFTDGITNQQAVPTFTVGNVDRDVPVLPLPLVVVPAIVAGNPWPAPFREGAAAASDSASDYATYYWVTDLRTAGPRATNNVPDSTTDPAKWQHVNFAAMSLGTEGKLPSGNQAIVEQQLRAGTTNWPQPLPNVYRPDASGVDDLWHAAINGRGKFINAQTADELRLGMGAILADITNQAGSRSGVAFTNVNLSPINNSLYRVRFEPGWSGSLAKVIIDPNTGAEISEVWEASVQLAAQLLIVPPNVLTPWFTQRKIVSMNDAGTTGVPFTWAGLSVAQRDSLAPANAARGQAILAFLRGDPSNEGSRLGQFRARNLALGDIVNSQPTYIGKPRAPYLDPNDPGYSGFKTTWTGRPGRVYVGANDGMMHAFDDATGDEAFAFIPKSLLRAGSTGLSGLSLQVGALPAFKHHYYVDSTPKVVDVDFGGVDWRSLLVGGLGKGGKAYYAIDVTDPGGILNEGDAAARVKWEYTHTDLGYTYGKPMIAKTRAFGGQWVVIFSSGYNNSGTGEGRLFFVDPKTGALLKIMTTGVGSVNDPSGLAHVAGYTKDYRNQLVEQIYGGDLKGNFWRFDVSNADPNQWRVDKLAYLTDPGGAPQPVTTPPQIEIDVVNGVDRWVFIGTGKLLDTTDLPDTQIQTVYAIRDGTSIAPLTATTTPAFTTAWQPRADFVEVTSANPLATRPDKGWYDDLPSGQRIVVPVQAALSVVAYSATSAQTDPCLTGQPATIYAREFSRGGSVLQDIVNGPFQESFYSAEGGVGLELVVLNDGALTGVPDVRLAVTLGTTGRTIMVRVKLPDYLIQHRMSWRLLGE